MLRTVHIYHISLLHRVRKKCKYYLTLGEVKLFLIVFKKTIKHVNIIQHRFKRNNIMQYCNKKIYKIKKVGNQRKINELLYAVITKETIK